MHVSTHFHEHIMSLKFFLCHNQSLLLQPQLLIQTRGGCYEKPSVGPLSLFRLGSILISLTNMRVWSSYARRSSSGQDASCVSGLKCVLRAAAGW